MPPSAPTTHASVGPVPVTALAAVGAVSEAGDQAAPFQCMMTPALVFSAEPTAQTSAGPLPHTLQSVYEVPLALGDHAVPFQWRVVPSPPTAQTSFGPF